MNANKTTDIELVYYKPKIENESGSACWGQETDRYFFGKCIVRR